MALFKSPYLLASATIVVWSFGAYLTRLVSLRSQFLLIALAFFFTSLVFGVHFTYQAKKQDVSLLRSFRPAFIIWGPLGYFLYTVPQIQSFRAFGSASEATILNYTWPFFTVIFTSLLFLLRTCAQAQMYGWLRPFLYFLDFFRCCLSQLRGTLPASRS